MKRNKLISIFKTGLLSMLVAVIGQSCVKSVSGRTDFENLAPTTLISDGGLANFSANAILFPPTDATDTALFHVEYASTSTAPVDEVITIGIDMDALAAFNALGGDQYAVFPDSIYSFTTTSVTVKKGNNYTGGIPLIMFPSKIDLLENYMLPISIKTTPAGSTISSNYKTIYWHLVGNPIAGIYNWDWTRWNNGTGTGAPTGTSFVGQSTVLAPDNGTTVEVPSGYYTQPRYVITFTNNGGVLSNFAVSLNASDISGFGAAGITITSGPNILIADPVNGIYEFQYSVSSGGNPRYLIDKYYK
jgi:Domain of unknown function (DUF1735)